MRRVILVGSSVLMVCLASPRAQVQAQPSAVMSIWHAAKGARVHSRWSYDNRDESGGVTRARRYVEPGDSVCVAIPNAHPVFYSYSIAAETLSVQTTLPAAPILLALARVAGDVKPQLAEASDEDDWLGVYTSRLNGIATALNNARSIAVGSDAGDEAWEKRSNFLVATEKIASAFAAIPDRRSAESLDKMLERWHAEAKEKASQPSSQHAASTQALQGATELLKKDLAKLAALHDEAAKTTKALAMKAGASARAAASLRAAEHSQMALTLRSSLAQLEGLAIVDAADVTQLLEALKGYGASLAAQVNGFAKLWNGDGGTYFSCMGVAKTSLRFKVTVGARDAENAKARQTGIIAVFDVVPRYREEIVRVTPVFTLSVTGSGEPNYQVKNGAVVDLGDSDQLLPQAGAMLGFRAWQFGADQSIVTRIGLGANIVKADDNLDRFFGALTIGYRDVMAVGVGVGRVRRQSLEDASILGKPLPEGKKLADYLGDRENRPAFYLTFSLSNLDALSGLGKLVDAK